MTAAAAQRFGAGRFFGERPQPGYFRSFALAFAVHGVLLAILFFGVRLQSSPPATVSVELWEPPPVPLAKPEPPKPPPKVEPEPPPKPEPKVEKPDIVEKPVPKKVEKKPEPKKLEAKKVEKKAEPPKRDLEMERRMREELAREQAATQDRIAKEALAREQAAAKSRALSEYVNRIKRKVTSNWNLPPDIQGNPEAILLVSQLPSGDVISVKIVKSSGNPAYDSAVERAILKSSPLPLPTAKEDFSRELRLTFRPKD